MNSPRPFFVLNPGGRDPDQDFPGGAGLPADKGHPPVNFHAFAACMRGGFRREARGIPPGSAVLLLLRPRHLPAAVACAKRLAAAGCRVLVSWKEAGWFQVQEALSVSGLWAGLCELARHAHAALCPVPELVALFRAAGFARAHFLPTPYPLEDPAWDFSIPLNQREGIFIGTREFRQPARGHRAALAVAAAMEAAVTVINTGGRGEERTIREIAPRARVIQGPLPYPAYLRTMASARVVFQLDGSRVPGQVAGDALLCRMPCAGGDSAIERLAFPALTGWSRDPAEVAQSVRQLLADDAAWEEAVGESRGRALGTLSFSCVRRELCRLLE